MTQELWFYNYHILPNKYSLALQMRDYILMVILVLQTCFCFLYKGTK